MSLAPTLRDVPQKRNAQLSENRYYDEDGRDLCKDR